MSRAESFVICWAMFFTGALAAAAPTESPTREAEPQLLELSGDLRVHDPVIAEQGGTYYVFGTGGFRGRGIVPILSSPDLHHWTRAGFVFARLPDWVTKEVPEARTIWAPDVSYFRGKYHLYYAVSSFGSQDSAIGLATNQTLDPSDPGYKWQDEGVVLRSRAGQDDFNAIDPNLVIADADDIWLCWGSFWEGIMMRRVDPETGKLTATDTKLYRLASRHGPSSDQTQPASDAIEAPFIVRHGDYWYLFVSWDHCCRGVNSDYKVIVGRSDAVTGPYVDKDGKPMSKGGGSLVVEAATDHWHGAGHQGYLRDDGTDYLIFHAYAVPSGRPRMQISTIDWQDGWPRVAPLP